MTFIKDKVIHKEKEEIYVNVKINDQINKILLDDYLLGVVAGEMNATYDLEALKAQTVASRTFVLSRDLNVDNTTNTQVYLTDSQMRNKWKGKYQEYRDKIKQAINETKDEVMMYDGEYISALFFSCSNGKTVNCEDYFEGSKPYLKAVDSHWDKEFVKEYEKEYLFSKDELNKIFKTNDLSILSYTESDYVKEVSVNGKIYTGRQIRELLNLASSCFTIELTSKGYLFKTRGYGHGVGMSQCGAQVMALESYNYNEILNHYYQNIEIISI